MLTWQKGICMPIKRHRRPCFGFFTPFPKHGSLCLGMIDTLKIVIQEREMDTTTALTHASSSSTHRWKEALVMAGSGLILMLFLLFAGKPGYAAHTLAKHDTGANIPGVEEMMKSITEKLDLTPSQTAQVRPIMEQFHEQVSGVIAERIEHLGVPLPSGVRNQLLAVHTATVTQLKKYLSDKQLKKYQAYMRALVARKQRSTEESPYL